ncbi:hypothetical protein [Sphingomonas sp.]|uniref:hypothetical protein n=1 Tax=Sphingomonas sp. TaxID=28214 RepID=UPI003BAABDAB
MSGLIFLFALVRVLIEQLAHPDCQRGIGERIGDQVHHRVQPPVAHHYFIRVARSEKDLPALVTDGLLITGQNPPSSDPTAHALLDALNAKA